MDTQDILDEAEEILHAYPTADGRIILSKTPLPKGTAHVPPAVLPLVLVVIVALVLPLLSIAFQLYMLIHPFTATILVQAQQVTSLAHVYHLPPVTIGQSQTVTTTGHKHIAATQATGLVTFYNASTQQQIVDAGTLLVGSDGEQVVTDQVAYLPAGTLATNGSVSVWAHAVDYGPAGNIAADDIYGACCRLLVQAVNNQFSGGHDAKDYPVVTQSDIATTVSNLQGVNNFSHAPDETLLTPVPCSSHVTSNHAVGDVASQVTVTMRQDCHPTAYKPRDVQASLLHLVAGKTKQAALSALLHLPGVRSVSISWADDTKLPKDSRYINLILLVP